MTPKASWIGGTISFTAVLVLSWLCQGVEQSGGFFEEILAPTEEGAMTLEVDTPTLRADTSTLEVDTPPPPEGGTPPGDNRGAAG